MAALLKMLLAVQSIPDALNYDTLYCELDAVDIGRCGLARGLHGSIDAFSSIDFYHYGDTLFRLGDLRLKELPLPAPEVDAALAHDAEELELISGHWKLPIGFEFPKRISDDEAHHCRLSTIEIVYGQAEFWFLLYPKHLDCRVQTSPIEYEELENMLKG